MLSSIHPNLQPLAFLLGTWVGTGKGKYPTIQSFEYKEESKFWTLGPAKPIICYEQKSWKIENNTPLHFEFGFIRAPSPNKIEFLITQPTGVVSVEEGTVENNEIKIKSTKLEHSSSAKHPWVTSFGRTIWLDKSNPNKLHYTFEMSTENQEFQNHLICEMQKKLE